MSAVKYVFVTCDACGAEVDRVEYDAGAAAPAVQDVANALNLSVDKAAAIVAEQNPGAELSSEDNARSLAEQIAAKSVKDRPKATYVCPSGCASPTLSVTDSNPTPMVAVAIAKQEVSK